MPRPQSSSRQPATTLNEVDDQQENNCPDSGIDDLRHQARAQNQPDLGKQPTADKRSDDANAEVGDDTHSSAAYDLTGEPARDKPNNENYENALASEVPFGSPNAFAENPS